MSSDSTNIISVVLYPEVWQSPQPRRMVYHGQLIVLTNEEYTDLISKFPEFWHTETDKLLNFRYSHDEGYFCERIKTVYNYATKEWSDTAYVFDAAKKEQVDELLNILGAFYQNYKLAQIKNINDEILNNIKDLSYLKMVILNSREKLLNGSDYMFNLDYKFKDEDVRQGWVDYRQKLRDITEQEAWKKNDYANIEMPVCPVPMKQLPDLVEEMDKIVPSHFRGFMDDDSLTENIENIISTMSQYMIKNQIIDGISKMSLPLLDLKVGTFDIVKSTENVDTFMSNFKEFKDKIDSQLQEIGSTLTVEQIVKDMTAKTIMQEVNEEVFEIINELNQNAE